MVGLGVGGRVRGGVRSIVAGRRIAGTEAIAVVVPGGLEAQISLHGLVALGTLLSALLPLAAAQALVFMERLLNSGAAFQFQLVLVGYDLRELLVISNPGVLHNLVQLDSFPGVLKLYDLKKFT